MRITKVEFPSTAASVLLILLSMFVISPVSYESLEGQEISWSEPWKSTHLSDYTVHDPIWITADSDFATFGFPGSGTVEDPYIISNLNITSTDSLIPGILIQNLNSSFVISDNIISAAHCIAIEGSGGFIIENNIISPWPESMYLLVGISLYECGDFTIRNNSIDGNWDHNFAMCIDLGESTDGVIEGNTFNDYQWGIGISGSNPNHRISNNTFYGSSYRESEGISGAGPGCVIIGNRFIGFHIGINGGYEALITQNVFGVRVTYPGAGTGISLSYSGQNTITNNSFYGIGDGIIASGSSNNIISENWFQIIRNYGISFESYIVTYPFPQAYLSEHNQVFRNVFIDTNDGGIQASDVGDGNAFDYNFWSDWAEHPDENNDGLIDDPYPIDGGLAIDPHPLANSSIAYSLDIESVPLPDPVLRFVRGNILLISLCIAVPMVLIAFRKRIFKRYGTET